MALNNSNIKLKYFDWSEFDSPDKVGTGYLMELNFILKLEVARELANVSFFINSGYRTKEHNKKIKGSPTSSHLKGLAVDIKTIDNYTRFRILNALIMVGFRRIGLSKSFIHVDYDQDKVQEVFWLY